MVVLAVGIAWGALAAAVVASKRQSKALTVVRSHRWVWPTVAACGVGIVALAGDAGTALAALAATSVFATSFLLHPHAVATSNARTSPPEQNT